MTSPYGGIPIWYIYIENSFEERISMLYEQFFSYLFTLVRSPLSANAPFESITY